MIDFKNDNAVLNFLVATSILSIIFTICIFGLLAGLKLIGVL